MNNLEILYIQSDLAWENPAQNRKNFGKKRKSWHREKDAT